MALNKYMHPRNIYKSPPDFAELAKRFDDFSSISKVDVTGKVTIDFKDPHALRVLTKCLLKSDFDLDVVIPEDRLVPTLPLRLNYILWIEDLLLSINRKDNIKGLDIGTGACAIYPLLGAVKNKWQMLGTETDQESFLRAQENINRNNLQNLIHLSKNPTATLMDYLFKGESAQSFDFCMCNPPFYSNVQELCESRSPARLPPKNGFTGSPQELITEGGELAFCRKMIKESQIYKDKILIFTTMVGHKYTLKELEVDLKAEGVNHTSTEFCQGRVTRWGLAWTYHDLNISKLVPAREKPRKKSVPLLYLLPKLPDTTYNFENVTQKLLDILQNLKLSYKVLNKKGALLSLDMKAVENTWSNQRRKRRIVKNLSESEAKKPKIEDSGRKYSDSLSKKSASGVNFCDSLEDETNQTNNGSIKDEAVESSSNKERHTVHDKGDKTSNNEDFKKTYEDGNYTGNPTDLVFKASKECIVHAFLKVFKKEDDILLEMDFVDGKAGKEGLHQIMQYIKNNWK